MIETQISGKYSAEDLRLFTFRRTLVETGIRVNYPAGDRIIGDVKGFALTEEAERQIPFHQVELGFFKSVRDNPVHIVFNIFKDKEGYIGESASLEIACALAFNKPIILLRIPQYADTVNPTIREMIVSKMDSLHIQALDTFTKDELRVYVSAVSEEKIDYKLTDVQRRATMQVIRRQLENQRRNWKQ